LLINAYYLYLHYQFDTIMNYKVTKEDLYIFNKIVYEEIKFEKFILESSEGSYRIDKTNKILTVLKRNYTLLIDNDVVDHEVNRTCKIAKEAGFNFFLENQYMN
jgi:hypothetical protein